MDLKIIVIYCVCSDFLILHYTQNPHYQMTDAEVVTFAITSAMFFYGNHLRTRQFLKYYGYIPNILSQSQLNRRLHAFDNAFWNALLNLLTRALLHFEKTQEYLVDSFPVSVCQTSRIARAKIYQGKEYHGYNPSKQGYFYGLKVHMVTTAHGIPIEVLLTPGSEHDMKAFKRLTLDLPSASTLYADRAYNNYEFEDFLKEHAEIEMIVQRKAISKRPLTGERRYIHSRMRKRIETVFSEITNLFPRKINAVTANGFELKIFSFILAYTFGLFFKNKDALA
jgi:transposase